MSSFIISGRLEGLTVQLADSPEGQTAVSLPSLQLPLGDGVPAEVEFPVEAAPRHVGAGDVLKRVVVDDVDDWTHDSRP